MIGWIGNLLFVIGAIFLACKKPLHTLFFNSNANVLYIVYATKTNSPPLLALSFFLCLVNIIGIYNYSKKSKELNGKMLLRKQYARPVN